MAVTYQIILECDRCHHTEDATERYGDAFEARVMGEMEAKEEGWRIGEEDVCPLCRVAAGEVPLEDTESGVLALEGVH